MARPIFTRRFWSDNPTGSSAYSSNKPSNGYESHLSRGVNSTAKASRLGFRQVRDPYDVSVLQTHRNESEEKIIAGAQNNGLYSGSRAKQVTRVTKDREKASPSSERSTSQQKMASTSFSRIGRRYSQYLFK